MLKYRKKLNFFNFYLNLPLVNLVDELNIMRKSLTSHHRLNKVHQAKLIWTININVVF